MLRSPENFLRASEHTESKSARARKRKEGDGPIISPFYISKVQKLPPKRFARRSIVSFGATARRISRRSRNVSGCQAYFPRSARRPRVPPVRSSYPSEVVWTRVHLFSRWDVLEVWVRKNHLSKACHMASAPASASAATKGPSAVSVPSPTNGPGGYCRCIRNQGSLSPETGPAICHASTSREVRPAR